MRPDARLDQLPDLGNGRTTGVDTEVVVTRLRSVRGTWVAEGFEVRTKTTTDQSKLLDHRRVVKVLDITPDPLAWGNTFKLTTPVPNGTPVSVSEEQAIKYEWRDGEVVKSVNQPLAEDLARQQFRRSSWWWAWMVGALALAVVAYTCVVRWRRSAAREG
jgi:hypothetical protein